MSETALRLAQSVALSELDSLSGRASATAHLIREQLQELIREQIEALDDQLPSQEDAETLIDPQFREPL